MKIETLKNVLGDIVQILFVPFWYDEGFYSSSMGCQQRIVYIDIFTKKRERLLKRITFNSL